MSDTELEGLIRESGLTGITEDMTEKLSGFADLLLKWNRVYNLTGVRTRGEMLVRNIMDSLVILPYLRGAVCLDAGTGPGLPGVPQVICKATDELRKKALEKVGADRVVFPESDSGVRLARNLLSAGFIFRFSRWSSPPSQTIKKSSVRRYSRIFP